MRKITVGADVSMDGVMQAIFRVYKGLNSNPHAITLFQSCNDAPRKVLAFVLGAMSVKVHDLSPTTELNIHTAFSSAIACELRRRPLMRVIYRVDTHWRLPPRVQ